MRRYIASLIFGALLAGGLLAGAQAQAVRHPDSPRDPGGYGKPPVYAPPPRSTPPKSTPPKSTPPRSGLKPLEPIAGLTGDAWVKRGSDADGEFDVLTLSGSKQQGPSGTVSILVQFRGYQNDRTPTGQAYRSGVVRFFFMCSERQYAPGNADYYDASGRLVGSDPGQFTRAGILPVRRGTVADFVYEAACGRDEEPGRGFAGGDDNDFPSGDLATGSGWLSSRGYIVTASPVIEGGSRIWIYQEGRKLGQAQVVKDDPVNDVAVLKPLFDVSAFAGMNVESVPLGLGQRVFTLGYPLVDQLGGGSVKLTSGDISSLTGVDTATSRVDDPRYIQISIPVQSGNSGGPVIDDSGSVVGIVLSKSEMTPDREIMQNVNFALKASYIAEALAALPQVGKPKPVVGRANLQATVAEVQSGVFLIVVEEGASRPPIRQTYNRPRQ